MSSPRPRKARTTNEQNPHPGPAAYPAGGASLPDPLHHCGPFCSFVVPLVFVAYYAFTDDNFAFTLENIQRFFVSTSNIIQDGWLHPRGADVSAHLLAVPETGHHLHRHLPGAGLSPWPTSWPGPSPAPRRCSSRIIMIPMWMNFLIRTYAWMTILQDTGIFNNFLTAAPPAQHPHHRHGGRRHHRHGRMTTSPYMILPLYSIMAKMDERLIEAARGPRGATVSGCCGG